MLTYVPPTGTIQFMTGVKLNPKQEDTIYFADKEHREGAFSSYVFATYQNQSYSRPTKNSVRIQETADNLYKANYMRFQNGDAFNSQWIYAFVLAVEYVNNNTTEVFYEIDDMITWFPQCELSQCFVEREIPQSDGLYENLVPENLELGEYIVNAESTFDMNNCYIILLTGTDAENHPYQCTDDTKYGYVAPNDLKINGIPSGLQYFIFDPTDMTVHGVGYHYDPFTQIGSMPDFYDTIAQFVDNGYADNILNLQLVPRFAVENAKPFTKGSSGVDFASSSHKVVKVNHLDSYFPKNKKLYSYPFSLITVSNQSGQVNEYKWELFMRGAEGSLMQTVYFEIIGTLIGNPTVSCYPISYRGKLGFDMDNGLLMTNFPLIPYLNDPFAAYIAQNKASITTSILSSVLGAGLSVVGAVATGGASAAVELGVAGAVLGAGTSIAKTVAKVADSQAIPRSVSNLSQNDAQLQATKQCSFYFQQMTIKREFARIIDEYFSAFGYAINRIKKPAIEVGKIRPFWTFTKTKGCTLTGNCPADALQRISTIFDKGIRFWKSNSIIGDYTLNNGA